MQIHDVAVFFDFAVETFDLERAEGLRASINVFGIFNIEDDPADETAFTEEPVSVQEWGPGDRCVLTLRNPVRTVKARCVRLYGVSIAVVDMAGLLLRKHASDMPGFPNGGFITNVN